MSLEKDLKLFSNVIIMNKNILRNSQFLESLGRKSKGEATPKVAKIIELYKLRKISQRETVSNVILKLISKDPKEQKKGFKQADKIIEKHKDVAPLNQRLAASKTNKHFIVNVLLFRLPKKEEDESDDEYKARRKKMKLYKGVYEQFAALSANVTGSEQTLKNALHLLVEHTQHVNDFDTEPQFRAMVDIINTNSEIKGFLAESVSGGLDAIYLVKYIADKRKGKKTVIYKPLDTKLQNSSECVSMFSRYISTALDSNCDTLREAIENKSYIPNECWINTIMDFYSETILSQSKALRYRVTREKLLELLNVTEANVKEGLKVNDVVPFFEKFKLQLKVFSEIGKLIFKFIPESPNKNEKVCYALLKGNHIYTINNNKERLRLKDIDDADEDLIMQPSQNYYVNEEAEPIPAIIISSVNEIPNIVKNTDSKKITLIHRENDLIKCCIELIESSGYLPKIKFQANRLTDIYTEFNDVKIRIQTQHLVKSELDGIVCVDDEDVYNRMNEAMCKFNKSLFLTGHKSFYSDVDVSILDEYRTVANNGLLNDRGDLELVEIDMSKAYTFALSQITEVPVFNIFDNFEYYANEPINDLSLYVVENKSLNTFFNKTYNLCYGKFLKKFDVKIIAVKSPSFIKQVSYNDIIQTLYNTEISNIKTEDTVIKKQIANVNIGLLEKGCNKSTESFLFKTLEEAEYHRSLLGGTIHMLQDIVEEEVMVKSDLDEDEQVIEMQLKEISNTYFILNVSKSSTMTNGFRYIKELLLQHHNYKIYKDAKKLTDNGIQIYSVKTDAFTIKKSDLDRAKKLIKFSKKFGGWRFSKEDNIIFPKEKLMLVENNEVKIQPVEVERLDVIDEYNCDELCALFEKHKIVMLRAEFAGSGKSYACAHMKSLGYKVLFVSPTNKLGKELNKDHSIEAITINRFFGFSADGESKYMKQFDSSEYNCIVFDEIYFYDVCNLMKVFSYCKNNNDKIILATGDVNQLECISEVSNVKDYEGYINHCINSIFPYEIFLKENKRLKKPEDKIRLKNIKRDILETDLPLLELIQKYNLKTTKEIITEDNIAYTNNTCKYVSKKVRKMLGKKNDYEVDEKLVCKKFFKIVRKDDDNKSKNININKNFEYVIVSITDKNMTLKDESTSETISLTLKQIESNFIHSYCNTCHSLQGSSIKKPITIHEWNFKHVSRKWLYTAITRATDLDNVHFMIKDENDKENRLKEQKIKHYFEQKCLGYIEQDNAKNRPMNEQDYVNVKWLENCVGKCCGGCGCNLTLDIDDNYYVESDITAQRLDNSIPHYISNIIPMCKNCNCSNK